MSVPKLGVVVSAGGSAILELHPLLQARGIQLIIATDRACPAEESCAKLGITHQRFAYQNRDDFSTQLADYFKAEGATKLVLLYYSRFVGAPLYDALPTLNIHPAALPSFPGLHAVEQAIAAKAPLLGATLHVVDAGCDTGPIRGQITGPYTPETAHRISFLQKSYLGLAAIDHYLLEHETPEHFTNATLALSTESAAFFRTVEARYHQQVLA